MEETPIRKKLRELVQEMVEIRDQPFTLKSGKKSRVYCDLRPLLLHSAWCYELAALLNRMIPGRATVVGGPVLGGAVLAQSINTVRMVHVEKVMHTYLTRPPKEHGKPFEKLVSYGCRPAGQVIALVEDVVTTGGSVATTAIAAQRDGMEIAGVFAIVNRSGRDMFPLPNPEFAVTSDFSAFYPLFDLDEESGKVTWNQRTAGLL